MVRPGRYRFELRRWPREEDRAIAEGIPGPWIAYRDIAHGYGGGRAIPLVHARIVVADHQESKPIAADDRCVAFTAHLNAGQILLQTYLSDVEAQAIGAYYVYVDRLT